MEKNIERIKMMTNTNPLYGSHIVTGGTEEHFQDDPMVEVAVDLGENDDAVSMQGDEGSDGVAPCERANVAS